MLTVIFYTRIVNRCVCRLGDTLAYPYTVSMEILKIEPGDFEIVLSLNAACVPHVNLISHHELQWFEDQAAFLRVAKIDGRFAGFLIGLRPGTGYDSPNYRWFCDNYEDFAYVDRVAVSEWARRRSVAETLYASFAKSQAGVAVMTCEVNVRPPNAGSMRFHERMGFRQVNSQQIDDGKKEVALMEKRL
jgi:predicted GNAT superfamily acetyltransferase